MSNAPAALALQDGLPMPARRWAMLVIVLGLMVAVLDGSIMNLALPTVAKQLNAQPAEAIWIVNAYQLGTLGLLLPLAALGERIGYRKVYLVGLALFTVASAVAMLAQSLWVLIAARGLQGMGAAGVMAVNAALVRLIYPSTHLPSWARAWRSIRWLWPCRRWLGRAWRRWCCRWPAGSGCLPSTCHWGC